MSVCYRNSTSEGIIRLFFLVKSFYTENVQINIIAKLKEGSSVRRESKKRPAVIARILKAIPLHTHARTVNLFGVANVIFIF